VVTLTLNTYSIRLASGPKRVGIPLRGVSGFQGGTGTTDWQIQTTGILIVLQIQQVLWYHVLTALQSSFLVLRPMCHGLGLETRC